MKHGVLPSKKNGENRMTEKETEIVNGIHDSYEWKRKGANSGKNKVIFL